MLTKAELLPIRRAMKAGTEYQMSRPIKTGRIRITVKPAPPVWGGVGGIVRLEWWGSHYSTQWLASVEDLKKAIAGMEAWK